MTAKPPASGEMQQAIAVEQSRVDRTGTSGAQVQQQGSDMIAVTVPGTPAYDVVNLVTRTSQMSVRPVYLEAPYASSPTPRSSPSATGTPSPPPRLDGRPTATPPCVSRRDPEAVRQGGVPAWPRRRHGQPELAEDGRLLAQRATSGVTSTARSCPATRAALSTCWAGPPTWAATSRRSAPGLQPDSAQWAVDLSLNSGAASKFGTLTTSQYGSYYAGSQQRKPR